MKFITAVSIKERFNYCNCRQPHDHMIPSALTDGNDPSVFGCDDIKARKSLSSALYVTFLQSNTHNVEGFLFQHLEAVL